MPPFLDKVMTQNRTVTLSRCHALQSQSVKNANAHFALFVPFKCLRDFFFAENAFLQHVDIQYIAQCVQIPCRGNASACRSGPSACRGAPSASPLLSICSSSTTPVLKVRNYLHTPLFFSTFVSTKRRSLQATNEVQECSLTFFLNFFLAHVRKYCYFCSIKA